MSLLKHLLSLTQGILTEGRRLSAVDLLINIACFVKEVNNIFNTKRGRSKLVSTMRLTVLSLPFSKTSLVVVFTLRRKIATTKSMSTKWLLLKDTQLLLLFSSARY
jgi:hypothetical protein